MRPLLTLAWLLTGVPQPQPVTPEASLRVRVPKNPQISPDGRQILFAVSSRNAAHKKRTDLYVVPIAGGDAQRLTTSGKYNGQAVWSPKGDKIAFVSRRGETAQIHILTLGGGEARAITDMAYGAQHPKWSPDGRQLLFTSSVHPGCKDAACNRKKKTEAKTSKVKARAYDDLFYRHWNAWRDETVSHLFIIDADGKKPPRDLTPGALEVPPPHLASSSAFDFVTNDSVVYCINRAVQTARSTNHDLEIVPAQGGKAKRITTNPALDCEPVTSPDGRSIAYLAHARAGFESDKSSLMIYDTKTGKSTPRSQAFDRPIGDIAWFPDGSGLFLAVYNQGHRELASVGKDVGEVAIQAPKIYMRGLGVGPAQKDGSKVAFVSSSLTAPPEVHLFDNRTRKVTQLTHFNDAWREKNKLGKVEEVTVQTKGGAIHGFVVHPPAGTVRKKQNPLVMLIHGGPQGAWSNVWHTRWNAQLFAAAGYVVALPNPRGSIGYGQKFTDAVTQNWGGGPYEDLMAFTDAMVEKPYVDKTRVCAAGASYGGYMVNWIAGHTDRFRCLISHAGLFHLEAFWGDTEELWFPEWEMGGPPYKSRAMYDKWSPHRFVESFRTPTLVVHGQLDYRVDLSHGLGMFTALRRRQVPARLVYFPDEGHWITKPDNFLYWYEQMHGWLSKYLK